MKQVIATQNAPAAIGPYSQAIRAGQTLYLSGQIPLDPSTGQIVEGDVRVQTLQVMMNLQAVLEAAGTDFAALVKTTIFLRDLADFAVVNEVYASFLKPPFPARATVQVARLPREVAVEIDGIAVLE
jgi:2-iminobutanoate/2-iminopropanoate deaminase